MTNFGCTHPPTIQAVTGNDTTTIITGPPKLDVLNTMKEGELIE